MTAKPDLETPRISPKAGLPAEPSMLTNIPRLIAAYYSDRPDPSVQAQRVSFGTSGHRGSSLDCAFNEWHILAITQSICKYRAQQGIDGPLFIGMDTHALSEPALRTALEVLAANGVNVYVSENDEYAPTPSISHAIITYNRDRQIGLADGIVITPSHNPPFDGGFKYNPPHGGPAGADATGFIEKDANQLIEERLTGVKRMLYEKALASETTYRYDYLKSYVADLKNIVDMDLVRSSGLRLGVDPLGGAGVHYWGAIGSSYALNLTVTNQQVDPTFRFMTVDWDGKIRMDPSSKYAMQSLIGLKDKFDVAFAADTDHDRHGVVAKSSGLLNPNHYLAVCIYYLFGNRPQWSPSTAVGKTVVSSSMIDRVAQKIGRELYEVPVGFKWFVNGLVKGTLGFVGEESAGSSFLRRDGTVWTTDKDGIIAGLLAAEMTAKTGRDPGEIYAALTRELGDPVYERIDAPATPEQKAALAKLSAKNIQAKDLAGEPISGILTSAPGDGSPLGGVKVVSAGGWFAARPSGTEEVYKIYAESFHGADHLKRIQKEAQQIVSQALE